MMKRMISVLAALMIVLAIVPAFAAPICPIDGCTMGMKRLNEKEYSLDYSFWNETKWDIPNDCFINYYYKGVRMTCDVYYVCSINPDHKSFIRTEQYTKNILLGTEIIPIPR